MKTGRLLSVLLKNRFLPSLYKIATPCGVAIFFGGELSGSPWGTIALCWLPVVSVVVVYKLLYAIYTLYIRYIYAIYIL